VRKVGAAIGVANYPAQHFVAKTKLVDRSMRWL
jgi:hypothetical protein